MHASTLLRLALPALILAAPAAQADICRVAADAGSGNGSSWGAAMPLQAALQADRCTEVWVRKGLYKPVVPLDSDNPTPAERAISFVLRPGVRVYGGFAGHESRREQRDPASHRAVLSGDIDNNDTTDSDGIVVDHEDTRWSNSYHVVLVDGGSARGPVTRATVLDGLVITAGRATGGSSGRRNHGAGLACRAINTGQECSPTLRNLVFSGNHAASEGGAIHVLGVSGGISRPLLERVRLSGNGANRGAGLYNDGSSAGNASPELVDVEFTGNRASSYGGAMYNDAVQGTSNPVLDRVGFSGNSGAYGGAIYSDATSAGTSRALISNATFHGNHASADGGAIYNYASNSGDTRQTLVHATFSGNGAARGGAIYNAGTSGNVANASPTLHGVILWGNTASNDGPQMVNQNAAPQIHASIVQGGCPDGAQCHGLVNGNPALAPLADNGGFARSLLPGTGSAAIDAAATGTCPVSDQRLLPRAQGTHCDIGAVEVAAAPCHVKHDASGSNNGSSWAHAYRRLQDALGNPACGEIRVARGLYTPGNAGDVDASFHIRPGQRVYGGFNGSESTLEQRNPAANPTVLSADIDGDDITDAHGILLRTTDARGQNAKRVVTMDGTTALGSITAITVLDGFAITGALGWELDGGGLLCRGQGAGNECSPTLRNLLFSANLADSGAGIALYGSAGGRANPTLHNVTLRNGSSWLGGAGMYNQGSHDGDASPTLVNVTFAGNGFIAMVNDGAHGGRSSPVLHHVTFHGNRDRFTAASMHNDARFGGTSEPTLTNVIIWGGELTLPEESGCLGSSHVEICNFDAQPLIRTSLIQGACPAGALCDPQVLALDPLLGPLADNGGATPTFLPGSGSPAIDAGAGDDCAASDQRDIRRPQGAGCDIGAVEVVPGGEDRLFANGFERP